MNFEATINKIKNNQLISDSLWSLLGNVFGRGLALIAGIIVARFLGKDIYGEYGAIRNTIITIGTFSTFGLGYTATKFIAELRGKEGGNIKYFIRYANNITLTFSGGMAILLFIFAKEVSLYVFKVNSLEYPLRILSILIIFNAITNTQIGILSGFGKFKELAKVNTFVGFVTFVLSVVLTYLYAFNGALIALLIAQILNCALNFYYVKKQTNRSNQIGQIIPYKEILTFSTPIALQEGIYAISSWVVMIVLIKYSSFGQLGMYTVAVQWSSMVLFIPGILRNVVLSHLSLHSSNETMQQKVLLQTISINIISTLIPAILLFIGSNLVESTYGTTFKGVGYLISVAVFTTVFTSVSNVYAQAYTSQGRNWLMFVLRTTRDISIIFVFLFLITKQIFPGALALIITNIILTIAFLILIVMFYKKKKND